MGPHADLFELTVTVAFQPSVGQAEMTYSLVRFRRDPQLALDIEEAAAAAEDGSCDVFPRPMVAGLRRGSP